jgi:ribosomal-protein-alanine N-acetyltransferase
MIIDSLSTKRLALRAFTTEDIERLHWILSNPEILRYMPRRDPWSMEKVEKWVEWGLTQWNEKGYGWWAVEVIEGEVLIGWCGLNYVKDIDEIEVLYLIDEEYWGKGLATEAAHASVQYAFEVVEIDRLIGIVHPDNIASRRVLEKIGMCYKEKAHFFGIDVDTYYLDRSSGG